MSPLPPLSPLADPVALAKLQILLVPVHQASSSTTISEPTYQFWASLIRRHEILRGDEIRRPPSSAAGPSSVHTRDKSSANDPRARFFPAATGISISRAGARNHVHLAYPPQPPARHLYPLSLLRMAAFPLVVIGIAVDSDQEEAGHVVGYSLREEDDADEGDGDIGQSSTPTATRFRKGSPTPPRTPTTAFDETLSTLFPSSSPFPLVRRLVIVPAQLPGSTTPRSSPSKSASIPNGTRPGGIRRQSSGKRKALPGVVYAPTEGVNAWASRVLGDVVGDVLEELGELVTALETPSGLRTLSSTLLPSMTSSPQHARTVFSSSSSAAMPAVPHRASTAAPTSTSPQSYSMSSSQSVDSLSVSAAPKRSLTPGGRPTSVGPPSLPPVQTGKNAPNPVPTPPASASSNPFRIPTGVTSPFTRTSSAPSPAFTVPPSLTPAISIAGRYTSALLIGVAGGRLMKLLGDGYLLAGLYGDAIKCYDDGAERCRNVGDVLWEALAREGRAAAGIGEAWEARDGSDAAQSLTSSPIPVEVLSHFQSALACLSRAPLPFPPTLLSPAPQAAAGSLYLPAPSAANSLHIGTGEGLLALLYSNLCLRTSHFVFLHWAAGGWGNIALSAIMGHSLPRTFPLSLSDSDAQHPDARRRRHHDLNMLCAKSQISRQTVFGYAEQALGPHQRAMTKLEQLSVHVEAVWLARWLNLPRKEALSMREVAKRIGLMIVEGRDEARRLARRSLKSYPPPQALDAATEAEAASIGLGLGIAVPAHQAVAIRRKESTEGNTSVMALLERAASIMGIDLLSLSISPDPRADVPADRPPDPPRFGWPELQVEVMKEGIAIADALPDPQSVVRLCTSALRNLHTFLSPQSQAHLAKMYPAAQATARRRGIDIRGVGWWRPGRLVLSLEIAGLPANRIPVEHARAETSKAGARDPFLYNPRLKVVGSGKTILAANEQFDVFVTLQNPFAFELDVQDLSLQTSGADFATSPFSISLPPSSVQTVRLSGIASSAGILQVRGVAIRLFDGSSTVVLLPVLDDQDRVKRDERKTRLTMEDSKTKRRGMDARYSASSEASRESDRAGQEKWLECQVVEEQPLLWIKKTNLTHGTVMLYDGEISTIRITVENSSSVPVDFIKLSFDDSAALDAQKILSEHELSPLEAYELDWDTLNRPVLLWENDDDTSISPGGRLTLNVRCLGKVGCTDGSIRIDYGCINRGRGQSNASNFFTRQITFPVLFTVYHTLEFHSLDLIRFGGPSTATKRTEPVKSDGLLRLPIRSASAMLTPRRRPSPNPLSGGIRTPRSASFAAISETTLRTALESESDDQHCLLCVSIRNVFGVPFEVTLSRVEKGREPLQASRLVPPGATERILLSLPRISLPSSMLSRPIPSLSDRQYVVEKTKRSASQLQAEREHFWYREELLKMLTAIWMEPGSRRQGSLSLRDQASSPALLDIFRLDNLAISLEIIPRHGSTIRTSDFIDVRATIVNHLERPFRPFIRIEPLPSSSSDTSWTTPSVPPRRPTSTMPTPSSAKNVIFDGLASTALPTLQPGEKSTHSLGMLFLASGSYSFRAAVEEIFLQGEEGGGEESGEVPRIRFSPLLHVDVG